MYDAKLFGDSSNKLLWRADIRLKLGRPVRKDEAGITLAGDLLRALMADGVTRPCHSAATASVTENHRGT
jgi:hypothetical protein